MAREKMSPLRARMIEDMRIRGLGVGSQKAHIRALKDFTAFLGRAPDTATPDDLRAYQLHMTDTEVTPSVYNSRITALRFFFGMTCNREDMKKYMQFRTEPRKLPIVLSFEEVSAILSAAPGPGLKYRAALGIGYGAGLRASEVTNLKVRDIDSDRMLIHVERGKGGKDRDVMLSPSLLELLRDYWREARPQGWLFPGQSRVEPLSSRQLNRAFNSAKAPLGRSLRDRLPGDGWPGSRSLQRCIRSGIALLRICWRQIPPLGRLLRNRLPGSGCAGDPGAARPCQADHDSTIHSCGDQDVAQCVQPVRAYPGCDLTDPAACRGTRWRLPTSSEIMGLPTGRSMPDI